MKRSIVGKTLVPEGQEPIRITGPGVKTTFTARDHPVYYILLKPIAQVDFPK